MRRMPSATASLSDAGSITLSTRRRASSNRSSAGNSSAARDRSAEDMGKLYPLAGARQVRFRCVRTSLMQSRLEQLPEMLNQLDQFGAKCNEAAGEQKPLTQSIRHFGPMRTRWLHWRVQILEFFHAPTVANAFAVI